VGLVRISLALALILAFLLRSIYTLYSGLPYNVDSWPLIAGASTFTGNTNARIFDDMYYDGYNNRWPYTIIATGLLALVTGSKVEDAGRLLGPALGSIAVLMLYAIARRLTSPRNAGLAALIVASAGTLFAFEGGLTKEVYARPLVLVYVLAAIYAWNPPVVAILALSTVMAHHVSSIALISIIAGVLVATILYDLARGVRVLSLARLAVALTTPAILLLAHVLSVAPGFWGNVFKLGNLAPASFYAITAFSIAAFTLLPSQRVTYRHRILFALAISIPALAMTLIAMVAPPTPQTTPLGPYMALYATPLLISPITAYTIRASREQFAIVGGWLIGMGMPMAYSAFSGDPIAGAAIHRFINYTFYAVTLGYTLGATWALKAQAILAILVAPLIAKGIMLQEDPYFHFELYKEGDVELARIARLSTKGVHGDSKLEYLAYMYKSEVMPPPLRVQDIRKPLAVHQENLAKGFWVAGIVYGSVHDIIEMSRRSSTAYSSGSHLIILPP
jgi:hypothetical protein